MSYTKNDWTDILPAAVKAKLDLAETGIKYVNDERDKESTPGRTLVEAATAAAQRTALGLGDSATKSVGTTAGTVAAGDDARLPTANEKTRLSDIQAATGATTALKLANLASPASTTQQGVALLGATGGAAKLTKMPDGATAVYSKTGYTDTTGYNNENTPSSILSVVNGNFRCAYSGSTVNRFYYSLAGNVLGGKTAVLLVRGSRNGIIVNGYNGNSNYLVGSFTLSTNWQIVTFPLPAISGSWGLYQALANCVSGDYLEIGQVWIGDYSYLTGSLSEEAARIVNQLGDTAGVGVAASGYYTFTSGTLPTAGKKMTIAGKVHTWRATAAELTADGDMLIGADLDACVSTALWCLNRTSPSTLDASYSPAPASPKYYAPAAHTQVTAAYDVVRRLDVKAKSTGIAGNTIALASDDTNIVASGTTLSGGIDDVGKKIITQIQNNIAASGTRPAAAMISDTATDVGYETTVDVASGGTYTLPTGGTWRWCVYGYGATVSSAKRGSSAGGTTLTVAGANATLWVRKVA